MGRDWAENMLSMYDDFHRLEPEQCARVNSGLETDATSTAVQGLEGADKRRVTTIDFLQAPSVEQVCCSPQSASIEHLSLPPRVY